MILELDIGNSRAKWRLRDPCASTESIKSEEFNAINVGADPVVAAEGLMQSLDALPWEIVERIWISNVRGQEFEELLIGRLQVLRGMSVEFARSVKRCAGVLNGYEEPSKLGVDRWLAMLAAYNLVERQCCIVDCGTTITIDLVSGAGLHLGGYIVPGVAMMKNSLRMRAAVLQSDLQHEISRVPGRNTAAAINNGVIAMIAGFITQVLVDEMSGSDPPNLFFTGGDGLQIKNVIGLSGIYQPMLVLDGLRFACCEPVFTRGGQ